MASSSASKTYLTDIGRPCQDQAHNCRPMTLREERRYLRRLQHRGRKRSRR